MQMLNVQSKTRQEVSCTNQTKRLMEQTKKETIEQPSIRKGRGSIITSPYNGSFFLNFVHSTTN